MSRQMTSPAVQQARRSFADAVMSDLVEAGLSFDQMQGRLSSILSQLWNEMEADLRQATRRRPAPPAPRDRPQECRQAAPIVQAVEVETPGEPSGDSQMLDQEATAEMQPGVRGAETTAVAQALIDALRQPLKQ